MNNEKDWVPDIPEDIVRKNLLAIRQDNKQTKEACEELRAQVDSLKKLVIMLQQDQQRCNKTINMLRAVVLGTGSTS